MNLKLLGFAIIFVTILSSCGKVGKEVRNQNWTTQSIDKNPIILLKQDPACVSTFSPFEEVSFSIYRFLQGAYSLNQLAFDKQVTGNYVKSRDEGPIMTTVYNEKSQKIAYFAHDKRLGSYKLKKISLFKIIDYGKILTVCPTTSTYKRDSVENAGLSASYSINKTYNAVINARASIRLNPIKLAIQPLLKLKIRFDGGEYNRMQTTMYETDNAFYDPRAQKITFLPHSEKFKSSQGVISFWEIPMVASHEYGHHIFNTLVIKKIKTDFKFSRGCFNKNFKESGTILGLAERDNKFGFALQSMNEGFADLISFYTLSSNERQLKGVPCFEKTREVDSKYFGDNSRKVFDMNAVFTMDSLIKMSKVNNCNAPDFQEIHKVGAVFAHGIDKLFSRTISDEAVKLKVLLRWAITLSEYHLELKDLVASDYIFYAMELAYKLALEEVGHTNLDVYCKDMKQIFTDPLVSLKQCKFLK